MKDGLKPIVYAGLIIIGILAGVFYFVVFASEPGASPSQRGVLCNTIEDNDGGTNVVFFSEEIIAQEYVDSLFEFSPMKERKGAFNFYYVDSLDVECEIYKGVALLCYSKDLIRKSAICPNDLIVVVEEMAPSIRSSAYLNVMSLNSAYTKRVFAHEFGHAFANLAEEYVPAKVQSGAKNCASECSKFDGLGDGCFVGCSEADYFRSVEDGIMRTLDAFHFGSLNEFLIGERISENGGRSITGSAIDLERNCLREEYYLIEGVSGEDGLEIVSKTREVGCVGGNGFGDSTFDVYDEEGGLIDSESFNPEFIFTDGPPVSEEGEVGFGEITGETFVSDKTFIIKVPVVGDVDRVEINTEGDTTNVDLADVTYSPVDSVFVDVSPSTIERIIGFGDDVFGGGFGSNPAIPDGDGIGGGTPGRNQGGIIGGGGNTDPPDGDFSDNDDTPTTGNVILPLGESRSLVFVLIAMGLVALVILLKRKSGKPI